MYIIIHRVNTIERLNSVPVEYGVEIDVRGYGDKLLLSHDPIVPHVVYDELEDYLRLFHHALIIFNVKEAGYEQQIIDLAEKYRISNYFLLDVEFPYFYRTTRQEGKRKLAVRYSEAEPIEMVHAQIVQGQPLVDWVWIDTNTILPLNVDVIHTLKQFKTCLVCPERWGRPQDIPMYIREMSRLKFIPDAVMTTEKHAGDWKNFYLNKESL